VSWLYAVFCAVVVLALLFGMSLASGMGQVLLKQL